MTDIAIVWGRKPRRPLMATEIVARAEAGGEAGLLARPGQTLALRLNTDLGRRYAPDRLAEVPDTEAKLAALKAGIERDVDLFARNNRRFVELYFDFIRNCAATNKTTIEAGLAWSGGLFIADDVVFSALRPLPYPTWIEQGTDKPLGADFAFWTGARLLVLSVGRHRSLPPATEHVSGLTLRDLESEDRLFTPERFPPEFLSFWKGDPVPSSPFRPAGLSEGIAVEDGGVLSQNVDSRI